uniref:Ankyrin repeat domain 29 n=1 Tax=Balaenoptera musculus TaxID=9771 RepID=A0A8C0DA81_BALMU
MCRMSLKKETPLANAAFWAARRGNLALLRLLLNSGRVDVDCRDSVRTGPFGTRMLGARRPPLAEHLLNTSFAVLVRFFTCLLASSFSKSPKYHGELQNILGKPL